jgi:hypothetical protein
VTRRLLVLAALVLVAMTSVTGVGSVTSMTADRGVSVAVADDGEAYLGIEFGPGDNGTRPLTVSDHATTDGLEVTVDGTTRLATPGDPAVFTVDCGSQIEILADGPDVRIEAVRMVEDCPSVSLDDEDDDGDEDESEDADD